ncbi:MAG TPA: CoA pyrophosphatase [Prolixibacteraceae bacterium]|nr:CoA pyrophosphatase [Prolixibacteraceae bacterium]
MNFHADILCHRLKKQLAKRLPGSDSHIKMLPSGRVLELPAEQLHYHESAVLILLFPYKQQIQICLIRRPGNMKNHAGQIAFPGGKREKEDADLVQTALREAWEEIGVPGESVEIIGELSNVYVHISAFLIKPVLGWLKEKPQLKLDTAEVDEVIFISLDDLVDHGNRCERMMDTRTGRISAPGFEISGSFIWGATAMMLSELIDICQEMS